MNRRFKCIRPDVKTSFYLIGFNNLMGKTDKKRYKETLEHIYVQCLGDKIQNKFIYISLFDPQIDINSLCE